MYGDLREVFCLRCAQEGIPVAYVDPDEGSPQAMERQKIEKDMTPTARPACDVCLAVGVLKIEKRECLCELNLRPMRP